MRRRTRHVFAYIVSRAADHDIEDSSNTQITIYSGRGLYIESTTGTFWLVGTAVEHHVLYQYQFANTKNIFASQLQTETPYFQPLPTALVPFTANSTLQDPTFDCTGVSGNCDEAWGLRILSSSDVLIYGSNHYSFFDNYSQSMYPACLYLILCLHCVKPTTDTPTRLLNVCNRRDLPVPHRTSGRDDFQRQHLQPQHHRFHQHA